MIDYTPHFAVVGGPSPHPSGDGRMGVCLIASKAIKQVELLEEAKEMPPWYEFIMPPKYKTTMTIEIDSRVQGEQYVIIWGDSYPEAWASLFSLWGSDIQPDNPQEQIESTRKAIGT